MLELTNSEFVRHWNVAQASLSRRAARMPADASPPTSHTRPADLRHIVSLAGSPPSLRPWRQLSTSTAALAAGNAEGGSQQPNGGNAKAAGNGNTEWCVSPHTLVFFLLLFVLLLPASPFRCISDEGTMRSARAHMCQRPDREQT